MSEKSFDEPIDLDSLKDAKVRDFVDLIRKGSSGKTDYNVSRDEFPGQYSKVGIHPNCPHNNNGRNANDELPWVELWGSPFCGGEFRCARCRRVVGWCFGCADEITNGLCDDCTVGIWKNLGVA